MKIVMFIFSAIALGFSGVVISNAPSDIQLGIAANAFFSPVILFGLGIAVHSIAATGTA